MDTIFNTPLEIGLRVLIVLSKSKVDSMDLQRLNIYDYLILHAGDINRKYPSIHPNIPNRSSEILVRRKILQDAIDLMYSKSLVDVVYDSNGISYKASKSTVLFSNLLESEYATRLKHCAKLVTQEFDHFSAEQLQAYVDRNMEKWGDEFEDVPFFRKGRLW